MESVADAVQSVVREYWLQHGREKDKEEKRVSLLRERFAHDLAARMAVRGPSVFLNLFRLSHLA
jgi:hypothetical protein